MATILSKSVGSPELAMPFRWASRAAACSSPGAAIARVCVRRGGLTRRTVGVTRGRDATRTADAKARAATLIDQ